MVFNERRVISCVWFLPEINTTYMIQSAIFEICITALIYKVHNSLNQYKSLKTSATHLLAVFMLATECRGVSSAVVMIFAWPGWNVVFNVAPMICHSVVQRHCSIARLRRWRKKRCTWEKLNDIWKWYCTNPRSLICKSFYIIMMSDGHPNYDAGSFCACSIWVQW